VRRLKRLILPGILLLAAYYAAFGGEHSYLELRAARTAEAREAEELQALQTRLDSLEAWADSLETDPAVLERVAREHFGMVRDGEVLYRLTETEDTSEADSLRSDNR